MERTEYRMGPQTTGPMGPPTTTRGMERGGFRVGPGLWLGAFAFGAALGGALGMLFAPRKGSEIRAALRENMPAEGISTEFRTRVNQALASGKASPTDLVNQAQRQLDDLRAQAINRLDDAKLRGKILQKQAELRYLQGKEKVRRLT